MRSTILSACILAGLFVNPSLSPAQTRGGSSGSSGGKCSGMSAQTLQKVGTGVSTAVGSLRSTKVSSTTLQAVQSDATALMKFARMSSADLASKQSQVAQALQKLATDLSTLSGDSNLSTQAKALLSILVAQVQQVAQNAQQNTPQNGGQ